MVQKCEFCKIKKVSPVFNFSCKCGLSFLCTECRMPETHQCNFDYKEEGKKLLTIKNPKIIGIKVNEI